ncbi:hypothetical protein ES702_03430 [subsurface metagenome]
MRHASLLRKPTFKKSRPRPDESGVDSRPMIYLAGELVRTILYDAECYGKSALSTSLVPVHERRVWMYEPIPQAQIRHGILVYMCSK